MKVVDLLMKLFRGDMQHINPYPFVPQKHKRTFQTPIRADFCVPSGARGYSKRPDTAFFEELDACPSIHVHSAMVLRHGKIIAEGELEAVFRQLSSYDVSLSKVW